MVVYNAFATTLQGYRPDLPTFSPLRTHGGIIVSGSASILAWASTFEKQANRRAKAPKATPKKAAPNATGYRPDLPTFGFSDAQLTRATSADRACWAANPLAIDPAKKIEAWRFGHSNPDAKDRNLMLEAWPEGAETSRLEVVVQLGMFNVVGPS